MVGRLGTRVLSFQSSIVLAEVRIFLRVMPFSSLSVLARLCATFFFPRWMVKIYTFLGPKTSQQDPVVTIKIPMGSRFNTNVFSPNTHKSAVVGSFFFKLMAKKLID